MSTLTQISGRDHLVLLHRVEQQRGLAIPVLWLMKDDLEVFSPLIDYFDEHTTYRLGWKRKAARAVGLYFDFSKVYKFDNENSILNRHSSQMMAFVNALQRGTIQRNGIDPTGLYWPPMSFNVTTEICRHLDNFVRWASTKLHDLTSLHPLKSLLKAFDQTPTDGATLMRFMMAARAQRSRTFLSYLKGVDEEAFRQIRSARLSLGIERVASSKKKVKAMEPWLINEIIEHGFVRKPNSNSLFEREEVTAKMIFLLLAGAGLRISEPLQMWYNDVTFPLLDGEERCIPQLRHPSQASTFFVGEKITRAQYLYKSNLMPRHWVSDSGTYHVGWKNLPVEPSTKSTEVYFIHPTFEMQFEAYFLRYLDYRRELLKVRIARGEGDHPFLFVSRGEDRRKSGQSYVGSPYSISAFEGAWERALKRVELRTGRHLERGHEFGTTPHALRHSLGKLLVKSGVPKKAIQTALHHGHILSQQVYTEPDWEDVCSVLSAARNADKNPLLFAVRENLDPYDETTELKRTWRF